MGEDVPIIISFCFGFLLFLLSFYFDSRSPFFSLSPSIFSSIPISIFSSFFVHIHICIYVLFYQQVVNVVFEYLFLWFYSCRWNEYWCVVSRNEYGMFRRVLWGLGRFLCGLVTIRISAIHDVWCRGDDYGLFWMVMLWGMLCRLIGRWCLCRCLGMFLMCLFDLRYWRLWDH